MLQHMAMCIRYEFPSQCLEKVPFREEFDGTSCCKIQGVILRVLTSQVLTSSPCKFACLSNVPHLHTATPLNWSRSSAQGGGASEDVGEK